MLAIVEELRNESLFRQPARFNARAMSERQSTNFTREHVFVTRANTPLRNHLLDRFYSTCQKAGIEDAKPGGSVDIHSLRVTFTTLSLEGGASPKAVQAILGHSACNDDGRLCQATERAKRSAVNSLPLDEAAAPRGSGAVCRGCVAFLGLGR